MNFVGPRGFNTVSVDRFQGPPKRSPNNIWSKPFNNFSDFDQRAMQNNSNYGLSFSQRLPYSNQHRPNFNGRGGFRNRGGRLFNKPRDALKERITNGFTCETCDKDFATEVLRQQHIATHVKCDFGGCPVSGHPKLIELHKQQQHYTGLADRIVMRNTPKDVLQWREERRKNWPSTLRTQEKMAEAAAREQRGELVDSNSTSCFNNKRGKVNSRGGRGGNNRQNRNKKPYDRNRNNRGRDLNRGGSNARLATFRQTDSDRDPLSMVLTANVFNTRTKIKTEDVEDGEILSDCEDVVVKTEVATALSTSSGLGSLMANYASDSEDDEVAVKKNQQSMTVDTGLADLSLSCPLPSLLSADFGAVNQRGRPRRSSIRSHRQIPDASTQLDSSSRGPVKFNPRHLVHHQKAAASPISARRLSLLQMLLAKDVERERSMIMQCVRHLVNKNVANLGAGMGETSGGESVPMTELTHAYEIKEESGLAIEQHQS